MRNSPLSKKSYNQHTKEAGVLIDTFRTIREDFLE